MHPSEEVAVSDAHDDDVRRHASDRRAPPGAERFAATLLRVLTAFQDAETIADAMRALADNALSALGAASCTVYRCDAAGTHLELVAESGRPKPEMGSYHRFPIDADLPGSIVARTGEPLWIASGDEYLARFPALYADLSRPRGRRAFCCAPLTGKRGPVGILALSFAEDHPFDADERAFVLALASQIAQTLERAEAEAAARRYNDRLRLLADASSRLSASLDLETTIDRVAGLALPALADFGLLDLVEPDGQIRRIARAHEDPETEEVLETLRWGRSAHTGLNLSAVTTGRAGLHPEIDDAWLERVAEGPDHLAILRRLGLRSMLTVPLGVRGRTVGALTLFHARSGRRHTREDVDLAAELAQRAAAAVENARLYAAARDASRLKDEFLGVVSHELRTPLTAILGWARILESRGHDAATAARAAEVITRNANAQIRIIDDILDVSRIVTGKLKLDLARVDVEPIAVLAVEALRPAAEARRVTLSLTRKSPLPPVTGDAARLQQVVGNLLSNAIKFARPGGRVEVRLSAETRAVRVEVADDGVGISPDFLPHVFDRFAQADSSSTRAHGGLGLGLAIVRHLVELHGGAAIARSDGPGRGSTFSVILPARADGAPERPLARPKAVRLDGLTILLAEDDTDTREAVVTMLEDLGAHVVATPSADDALAALDAAVPDLLVSDIGMPERDGFALLRLMRARGGRAAAIPAVALTAFAGLDDRQRILGAGFAAHVPKPVDPAALSGVIARVAAAARA